VLPLAALYMRPVGRLATQWMSSADDSYGIVLAAAAAWIAWDRREVLRARGDRLSSPLPGLALLVLGLFMYVAGSVAADVFLLRESLVVVLAGTVAFFAGRPALGSAAVPLLFLAVAIPLPALLVNSITLPLQLVASRLAESILTIVGVPVFRDGNLLVLPRATLEVAEACSGLRSLVSLTAIALLLAWIAGGSIWRRALIVLSAVPIAIAMNGLRIAATGGATLWFGAAAARGAWHTTTGWLTFVASTAVLVGVQRRTSIQ
jgi:exosortase